MIIGPVWINVIIKHDNFLVHIIKHHFPFYLKKSSNHDYWKKMIIKAWRVYIFLCSNENEKVNNLGGSHYCIIPISFFVYALKFSLLPHINPPLWNLFWKFCSFICTHTCKPENMFSKKIFVLNIWHDPYLWNLITFSLTI